MLDVALYIVSGLTLYAGGHHLYLGGNRASSQPHLQLGMLYLLLSGFALASAMTYQTPALEVLLPAGKVAVSLGLILWCALVWHIAFRSGCKPWLVLDLITAGWLVLLIQNMISPNSLIYADVFPVRQTLINGETRNIVHSSLSSWWTAAEIAMLVSLAFCAYATFHLYRRRQKTSAYVIAGGLGLLALVALYDHLVSTQIIRASFLAPFGFLGFLLVSSLYPVIRGWRDMRTPRQPPMIYNLSFKPECASFHTDVSQLRTPLFREPAPAEDDTTGAPDLRRADSFPVTEDEDIHDVPADTLHVVDTERLPDTERDTPVEQTSAVIDEELLHSVTDNLIDIAVYATMALNRFKRGDAEPETLEALCRKVRSRAIKTRRLAIQLNKSRQPDYHKERSDD